MKQGDGSSVLLSNETREPSSCSESIKAVDEE